MAESFTSRRARAGIRATVVIAVIACALLPACGGGGGGGGDSPKTAPQISSLTFMPTALYVGSAVPFTGSFDFSDPDGDIVSATLETLDDTGKLLQSVAIPVEGMSGAKSGTIQGVVEGDTSTAGTYTVRVYVTDRAGLRSNALTASLRISEFPWVARTPMPLPRRDFATATVNGRIYVLGGGDTTAPVVPSPPTATVQVYDPATDSWTTSPPMPLAVTDHAAAVVNGRIYVAGGRSAAMPGVRTLQVYDPATGLWVQKADLPVERVDSAATGAGGVLMLFGGRDPGMDMSTAFAYDPALDQWSTRAAMPDARSNLAAITIDGKPLILGGFGTTYVSDSGYCRSAFAYDPGTDAWTQRADMHVPRSEIAVASIGGKVYAAGGGNWDRALQDVSVYDPQTNAWSPKTPLPQGLAWPRGESVNGKMYVFDGSVTLEYTPANDIL